MACNPKLSPLTVMRQAASEFSATQMPVVKGYSTPIIDRLSALPGGDKLAALARASFTKAANFHGSMQERLETLGHQLGVGGWAGGPLGRTSARGRRGQKIRNWLNGHVMLPDGSGAIARSVDLMNRPLTQTDPALKDAPPGTWDVLRSMREVTKATGAFMELSGVQIRGVKMPAEAVAVLRKAGLKEKEIARAQRRAAATWVPFKAAVDGNRMTRQATVEGQHVFETGAPELAVAIHAANPEIPLDDAKTMVNEIKKSAVLRRSPMESARKIPVMPTHILMNGKLVQILETDPWAWAGRVVHSTGMRGAAVQTFGQDLDVTGTNAVGTTNPVLLKPLFGTDDPEIVAQAVADGALEGRVVDAKAKELERFIRAINGQPITMEESLSPKVAAGVEALNLLGSAVKTALLSKSALVNLPEVLGSTATFAGWRNTARAMAEFGRAAIPGRLGASARERMAMVRELGAVNRDLLDTYLRPGRLMQSLAQGIRGTGGRLTLSQPVNKMNEYVAAVAGSYFVQELKSGLTGRPAEFARARLLILGYSPAQAESMVSGSARQELLDGVIRRMVETSLGTTSFQGERSLAATHPMWSRALWFSSFNQMKLNRTLRQTGLLAKAITSRKVLTVQERGDVLAMTQLMGMQLTGTTVSAATANLIRAFALFGIYGLLAEFERDPDAEYAMELVWSGFGGGPAEAVASGFASGDTIEEGIGNAFIRATGAVSVAKNLLDAFMGNGKYRDQDGFQRASMFLQSSVPATSTFLTLGWSLGLYQDDKALDAATKSYWTWRRENGIMPPKVTARQDASEVDAQAKIHIKNAWELLTAGEDLTGEKMARELSLALGFKAQDNAFELFESKDALITSLRNRKYWRPQTDWTPEQQAQARASLGPIQTAKLDEHDRAIDLLISTLEVSVGKDYRVPVERARDADKRMQEALRLMGDFEAAWPATAEAYARESDTFAALKNFDLDQLPAGLEARDRARIVSIQRAGLSEVDDLLKRSVYLREKGDAIEAEETISRIERATQRALDGIGRSLQNAGPR